MRPSWHLDVKWLSALAAVFLLFAASVSYTLYRLTEHDTATGAFTAIAVGLVEENFDSEEFERIKAEAAASPDTEYTIPGVNITVTGSELADLTPTEALELVIGRAADTLYFEGADAAQALFQDEATGEPTGESANDPAEEPAAGQPSGDSGKETSLTTGPFSIFAEDNHDFFRPLVYAFVLVALVAAIPLVLYSRRYGRLGSPGMVLLAVTAPAALLWAIARRAAATAAEEPDKMADKFALALTPAIDDLARTFLYLAAVGGVAVAVAVGGHTVAAAVTRVRSGRGEPESSVPEDAVADPAAPAHAGGEEPSPRGGGLPSIGPGGVPQA